jgi:hypothetical protein
MKRMSDEDLIAAWYAADAERFRVHLGRYPTVAMYAPKIEADRRADALRAEIRRRLGH